MHGKHSVHPVGYAASGTKASGPAQHLSRQAYLLHLQRTAGNEAVSRLIATLPPGDQASGSIEGSLAQPGQKQLVVARAPGAATATQGANVPATAEQVQGVEERAKLREDLKSFIVLAVEKFGRACANQKDEIKAQAAEDKEMFSMILDIGFSFVPGLLPLKGLAKEGFKKGAEIAEKEAEKVVEASLKGVQQGIMKARGSHESELEQFIDHLADEKEEAAVEAIEQADKMSQADLETTAGYYKNYVLHGDPEGQIKRKLDAYKTSARHVGEFRYWEFGASGVAEAVFINVGRRNKLALITFPSPVNANETFKLVDLGWTAGQPVWLDWIPKDMEAVTKEKQFNEYGPFKFYQLSDCLVPPTYFKRWAGGLSN
jgi:hypothetical protein